MLPDRGADFRQSKGMRVLFIGGTGNISIAATRLLAERGVDLTLLNRGQSDVALPDGVRLIHADIRDRAAAAAALEGEEFDVVVDWVAFVPEHVETDIALFAGRISHYVFISSATVYQQPPPFFPLGRGGAARERALAVRARQDRLRGPAAARARASAASRSRSCAPRYTYGEAGCRPRSRAEDYTIVDRMRRGKKIIVHGDGESLWTMTHNTDFARALVGLLGNPAAARRELPHHLRRGADVEPDHRDDRGGGRPGGRTRAHPVRLHRALEPELRPGTARRQGALAVFDNSKIKRFVPGLQRRFRSPRASPLARLVRGRSGAAGDRRGVEREAGSDRGSLETGRLAGGGPVEAR